MIESTSFIGNGLAICSWDQRIIHGAHCILQTQLLDYIEASVDEINSQFPSVTIVPAGNFNQLLLKGQG